MGLLLSGTVQAQHKPNVVVFLADDLGTNELSCYGGQNLETPNIDRLANEGVRLTNCFASMSMSVPIRASLYTGLYPQHNGSYQNHKATYAGTKSVVHYMGDLGYRVGRSGKDHPAGQPIVYPFEKIDGFEVECTKSHPAVSTTDSISRFITRDDSQPFCLFVCSINSHMPWDSGDASEFDASKVVLPPNCVDNAKTRSMFCNYLAEIRMLDNEVGMVYKALEDAGKLDSTLFIFLGEQGPQMPFGKWTCYRYGQHSAFIARFPSKIKGGTTSDAIVQYEDILPTLIDFAGGDPVAGLDGESALAVLYGDRPDLRQWAYGMHNNIPVDTAYPIRSIQDKRFKLIENLTPDSAYYEKHMMAAGDNMWNSWVTTAQSSDSAAWLVDRFVHRPAVELYDHQADPWELNNLAGDSRYASKVDSMEAALATWMEETGDRGALLDVEDPDGPQYKEPVAIGSYEEFNTVLRGDLTGNYYLSSDITIPEGTEWVPIGAAGAADGDPGRFSGILDGQGHSIKGLKIAQSGAFKGLFGRMDHGTVRNLNLVDVDITGKAPTGGVTGAMIGASTIEQVSVTGTVKGGTEIGGIAGRVARDATHTGYNTIRNCYVNATVRATNLSTALASPSCAGGIVAFMHSNASGMVAKLDIENTYFAGSVSSAQTSNISGCAAGMLAFTDNTPNVRMKDVLVLANGITAGTPNYIFCRRLPSNTSLESLDGLYVRDDITLTYAGDAGVGGNISSSITKLPDADFRTRGFYDRTQWDFDSIWTITEGEYPVLTYKADTTTSISSAVKDRRWLWTGRNGISVDLSEGEVATVYDMAGRVLFIIGGKAGRTALPLAHGTYVIRKTARTGKALAKCVI